MELRGWITDRRNVGDSTITWKEVEPAWNMIYGRLDPETKQLIDKEGTDSRAASVRVIIYLLDIHLNQRCNKQDSWKVKNAISSTAKGVMVNGRIATARLKQSIEMKTLSNRGAIWYGS